MKSALPYFRQLWRLVFVAAMLCATVMACMPDPPTLPGDPSGEAMHLIGFVLLTIIARAAFWGAPAWKLMLGLIAFGGAIELLQLIPAFERGPSLDDWLLDAVAVAIAMAAVEAMRLVLRLMTSANS